MSEAGRQLTAAEVAAAAGVSVDRARRLWRSLGFPEHGDAPAFGEDDVKVLRMIGEVVDQGVLDFELAMSVARGVGLTIGRLADWEVGALAQRAAEAYLAAGGAVDGDAHEWVIGEYGEKFEELMLYSWRRHLTAAVARIAALGDDGPQATSDLTVGFADIVGFTALSNELTRDRIGDLVEVFETRCGDVIAAQQGRMIKSMGDAVLFVNDDPLAAFATAEGIINIIGRDRKMPDVRLGLASGPVVLRLGDVYGPPVNLAARLTAVARRNRIIIDDATAAQLPESEFEWRRLPARPVRGFGIVEPVTARRI